MRGFLLCLSAVLLTLGICLHGAVADDEDKALAITVDGTPMTREQLEQERDELDADLTPATAETAALRAALQNAIDLMTAIADAPNTIEDLKAKITAQRAKLSTDLAEETVAFDKAEVDDALIKDLEAQSAQAGTASTNATDALTKLEEAATKIKTDFAALPERKAALKTVLQALKKELEGKPEDDAQARQELGRQIRTNQIREGMADLRQAHHVALLEIATLDRDRAQFFEQGAATNQKSVNAKLSRARRIHETKLAAEAERKAKEAREKLEALEKAIEASAAKKAIVRIEVLLVSMDAEEREEHALESQLASSRADLESFRKLIEARFESIKLLYPAGVELEPWQREEMAEQLRQLEEDEVELGRIRASRSEDLNATIANAVTKRWRLDIFNTALQSAQDKIEVMDDAGAKTAAIERELKYSRDDNYTQWLQARLDFLGGQSDATLRPIDLQALRKSWNENTVKLQTNIKERLEDLDKIKQLSGELQATYDALGKGLADRRTYLERLTFWLRGAPLFSGENIEGARADFEGMLGELEKAPAHLDGLRDHVAAGDEAAHRRVFAVSILTVLALFLGLVVSRRIGKSALLQQPISALDGPDRLQRGVAAAFRRLIAPVSLLIASVYVRSAVLSGDICGTILVGVMIVWTGWRLVSGINRGFFQVDEDGLCVAGCDAATAKRARKCVLVLVMSFVVGYALILVLRDASHERLVRFVQFAWGSVTVLVASWLVWRRDVLNALVPWGGLAGRTLRGMLHLVWPLAALFFAGVLVMGAMGYYTAAIFYGQRALLCAAALVVIGVLHTILDAMLERRLKDDENVGEPSYDTGRERRRLGARFLSSLNTLGTIVVTLLAISAIFDLTWAHWVDFGDTGLFASLTIGKLAQAILIFGLSIGVARFIRDLMRVVLRSRGGLQKGSRYAVRTLLFYTIVTLGTLAAFSQLGVELSQLGWFLTAAGVGIGFGLQEIISNFISGLILFMERPVQVGDVVTVGDVEGNVQQINIRATVVRTRDGVSIIVPNKSLITGEVINWSHGEQRTRLQLQFGTAYGSDVKLVKELLIKAVEEDERIMKYPKPEVEFRAFGESELQFVVYLWLPTPEITARRRVRSTINGRVDELFAENGIEIPFPQRDLHLRSSDIGSLGQATRTDQPDDEVPEIPSSI